MSTERQGDLLTRLELDRGSSVQLHAQLEQQIREHIETRHLQPGQRLPTNHEIQATLDVNYKTVQRAMARLAEEGLVIRRPGKGTFVHRVTRPGVVGIFCTYDVLNPEEPPFYALMAHHLSQLLRDAGRDPHIYFVPGLDVGSSRAFENLLSDLEQRSLAGLILLNYEPEHQPVIDAAQRRSVPVVSVTSNDPVPQTCRPDLFEVIELAARAAAGRGRSRGCVFVNGVSLRFRQKELIIAAAARGGLAITESDIVPTEVTADAGVWVARTFPIGHYDTAILTDDVFASGFARGLARRGVAIPEQLGVFCYWNRGNRLPLVMPFVRLEVDVRGWAKQSLELLDALIKGRRVTQSHRRVPIHLMAPAAERIS